MLRLIKNAKQVTIMTEPFGGLFMKWNDCKRTVREGIDDCCRAFTRPVIRKRIDVEMGIYGEKNDNKPMVGFDIDGEWCYKLSWAIKVMAVVLFVVF